MVRAYCYHARACINLSRACMEHGNVLWRVLPAGQRENLYQLVVATKKQVNNDETYKPYVISDKRKDRFISENERLDLIESGKIVLSFIEAPRTVILYLSKRTALPTQFSLYLWGRGRV